MGVDLKIWNCQSNLLGVRIKKLWSFFPPRLLHSTASSSSIVALWILRGFAVGERNCFKAPWSRRHWPLTPLQALVFYKCVASLIASSIPSTRIVMMIICTSVSVVLTPPPPSSLLDMWGIAPAVSGGIAVAVLRCWISPCRGFKSRHVGGLWSHLRKNGKGYGAFRPQKKYVFYLKKGVKWVCVWIMDGGWWCNSFYSSFTKLVLCAESTAVVINKILASLFRVQHLETELLSHI